jgi:hypothetical protein
MKTPGESEVNMFARVPGMSSRTQRTNRLAIAALVFGIVSFFGLFPAGIVAIILSHKAKRKIRQTGENGRGLAKAGLILGYIGIALVVVVPLLLGVFLAVTPTSTVRVGH